MKFLIALFTLLIASSANAAKFEDVIQYDLSRMAIFAKTGTFDSMNQDFTIRGNGTLARGGTRFFLDGEICLPDAGCFEIHKQFFILEVGADGSYVDVMAVDLISEEKRVVIVNDNPLQLHFPSLVGGSYGYELTNPREVKVDVNRMIRNHNIHFEVFGGDNLLVHYNNK